MPLIYRYTFALLLLVGAFAPLPYGYYGLLKLFACGVFAWSALMAYEKEYRAWIVGYVLFALAFNPFFPIYLSQEVWVLLDISAAALLLVSPHMTVNKTPSSETNKAIFFRKVSIFLGATIAVICTVVFGLWAYNNYSHLLAKQTAYYGVSLGMTKKEVQYILGKPDTVDDQTGWESAENEIIFHNWSAELTDYILKSAPELSSYTQNSFRSEHTNLSDRNFISYLYKKYW